MEENFDPLPNQENKRNAVKIDKRNKECGMWSIRRPSRVGRQKASNLTSNKPGVNPFGRNATTLLDARRLFFTAELIYNIDICTNECM